MKDPRSSRPDRRTALHEWFCRSPGKLIAATEALRIREALAGLRACRAVQVGGLGETDVLTASRAPFCTLIALAERSHDACATALRGSATALPIDSETAELVILPHVLEFEANPHEALREAARLLLPEGYLIVTGFNPWSQFGAARLLWRRGARVPWCGNFLSFRRLRDWLALLGLDLCSVRGCFFRPPLHSESALRWLSFMETAGPAAAPWLAGVYVVLARKRVATLTPIRPSWAPRARLVSVGLAGGAAARTHGHG